ncbi:hypothetical protein C9975_00755 [Thalassospira xiamenensis]|nr:hypothetical protein C9975_00755 [Thalassospira xiamenensis]
MKLLPQQLNLSRLSAFAVICEEGSLSRASLRLGIAQPALSNMIKKLEEDLGTRILMRHARGSTPTQAGEVLLKGAYEMLAIANATISAVGTANQEPEGDVAIGLPAATSTVLAIPLIKHLRNTFPKVSLRVVEAFSGYLWGWLQEGTLDFAISFDRTSLPDIVCHPICDEEIFLVGNQELMRDLPQKITPEMLGSFPLILPSTIHGIRMKAQAFAALGSGLDIRMEIDASTHLVKLIASGEGYGLLAKCAIYDELANHTVKATPLSPPMIRQVSVCAQRIKMKDPVLLRVLDEIQNVSRHLIASGKWPVVVAAGDDSSPAPLARRLPPDTESGL